METARLNAKSGIETVQNCKFDRRTKTGNANKKIDAINWSRQHILTAFIESASLLSITTRGMASMDMS